MQDDFEADSSERPDPELLAEDDLGGMMEASKTMDYDSDTSNDDPIDYEEEDERWEDERSEVDEPSQQEMNLMISHAENDKNVTYLCSRITKQPTRINKRSCRVR